MELGRMKWLTHYQRYWYPKTHENRSAFAHTEGKDGNKFDSWRTITREDPIRCWECRRKEIATT
eukprot:scaffold1469_cov119-Cylindrotheca_fusiformis.AAC.34